MGYGEVRAYAKGRVEAVDSLPDLTTLRHVPFRSHETDTFTTCDGEPVLRASLLAFAQAAARIEGGAMNRTITTLAGAAVLGLAVASCGSSGSSPPPAAVTVTHTRIVTAAPEVVTVTAKPRVVTVTPTAAPAPTQAAPAPTQAPNPGLSDPVAIVTQFYADITAHDYGAAWALGGDNIAATSYANWVAGYGTTVAIAVTSAENFGGDQATVSISATQTDGSVRNYTGTYTVQNGVIVSAQITQQ